MATTDRYKRISRASQNLLTKPFISSCAFSASDFEGFLLPLQSDEPKIHLLYPSMSSMCKLVSNLMGKFIRKRMLSGVESKYLLLDIHLGENRKPLHFVEIRAKTSSKDQWFKKLDDDGVVLSRCASHCQSY